MLFRAPAPKAGVSSQIPPRPLHESVASSGSLSTMATMRSQKELERARSLFERGLTSTEVSRITGIPRSTIRDWLLGYCRQPGKPDLRASDCSVHDVSLLDEEAYSYLLGIYLGDGCLSRHERGVWKLRITLDAQYPRIIAECCAAIRAVAVGKRANVFRRHDCRCVEVSAYWKHWPCLFPQHGPGRKHERPIRLADWQESIIDAHTRAFLRALIHSDGCRAIATERKGAYVRRAPRYVFSNRSEDILQLFAAACRLVDVHFTRPSRKQIAVYSKDAVARLDEFIGPKR
jgi:hypothetical protein